ncbi:hypothetical protein M527_14040 [Sphingobium indicum IP26]|nr:hypothetical protein M527_14040 [Sphingobium indicum IP26]
MTQANYQYVSAACGAGKTTATIYQALKSAERGFKTIIAQPTKVLVNQTYLDLNLKAAALGLDANKFRIKQITDENLFNHNTVTGELTAYLKNYTWAQGEVLIITHAALQRITIHNETSKALNIWDIYIDETLNVIQGQDKNFSKTFTLLTDHFEFGKGTGTWCQLKIKDGHDKAVKEIWENKTFDSNYANFKPFLDQFYSPNYDLWVHAAEWFKLIKGESKIDLPAFSLLKPSVFDPFRSVTAMSALFERTLMFKIWKSLGVEWSVNEWINKNLRYSSHDGSRTTLHYLFIDKWSKAKSNKKWPGQSEYDVFTRALAEAEHIVSGHDFIKTVNNSHTSALMDVMPDGTKVSSLSHGLNSFQDRTAAIFLSALNPSPFLLSFVETVTGLDADDLTADMYEMALYQTMCRINIRNPNDKRPTVMVVPDKRAADFLQTQFIGAKAKASAIADVELTTTRTPATTVKVNKPRNHKIWDNETQRNEAGRKKAKLINKQTKLQFHTEDDTRQITMAKEKKGTNLLPFPYGDHDTFIQRCADEFYVEDHNSKNPLVYFIPSTFQSVEGASTVRGRANVVSTYGIWFDFDGRRGSGVSITPEDIINCFPQLRMMICNSPSGLNDDGNQKFHVYIPTSHPMLASGDNTKGGDHSDNETFWVVKDHLIKAMEDAGIKLDKDSGFDKNACRPEALISAPRQAKRGDSFFYNIDGEVLDVLAVLKATPTKYWKKPLAPKEPIYVDKRNKGFNSNITLESVGAELIALPKGGANDGVYIKAMKLYRNCYTPDEIEQALTSALNCRVGGRDHINNLKNICKEMRNGKYGTQ